MTDREKLTKLVDDILSFLPWGQISSHTAEEVADHLIANGVTFATDKNVGRWIPVAERLPEEDQVVLCVRRNGNYWVASWTYIDWMWYDENEWHKEAEVTHWMPLPEPPKEAE